MTYDDYRLHCINLGVTPLSKASFGGGHIRVDGALVCVEALHWHDTAIELDGYRFTNCRFDNCQLFFKTTVFKLDRSCRLRDCSIEPKETDG